MIMGMSIPFDTLDYDQQLAKAGVPAAQAEQQSRLLADVLGKSFPCCRELATVERNVLARVETSEIKIANRISALRGELSGRINTIAGKVNLAKLMLGTLIALNAAIMIKVFFG